MKSIVRLLLCLSLFTVSSVYAGNLKFVSAGDYIDRNNTIHPWSINEHNTLIWEGNPYIPVGGVFYSRYVSEGANDTNWRDDVKALETLKSKGITDLLLKNIGPASWVAPESWQKLIDYLDANDFTYGFDLADNPQGILNGFVIRPHRYRLADVQGGSTHTFNIPNAVSAVYVLANASDGSVVRSGTVKAFDGKLVIDIKSNANRSYVLLLYPELDISRHGDHGIPNVWDGYDAHRDKLLAFLGKLKFGKGLRFFLDPIDVRMSLVGDLASAIPNSDGFRLQFESWLLKKYPTSANVASAWGLVAQDVPAMQNAARLLPMWHGRRGVPKVYDPSTGQMNRVMLSASSIWEDIIDFRDSSIRSYMNAIADVLKSEVANVPVVFRVGDYYQVYSNDMAKGGFDGLAVDIYGRGEGIVADKLGSAYSLASESAKTMWTIVSGASDMEPAAKQTPGFESKTTLTADLSLMEEGGAKGIYIASLQMSPKSISKNQELLSVPEQLEWVASFKKDMSDAGSFSPFVVYYPSSVVSGATARRLGKGAWWLPSLKPAKTFNVGDEILGYAFDGDNVNYLWSLDASTTVTLKLLEGQEPLITYPDPPGDRAFIEKDKLVLKLDRMPMGVRGLLQSQIVPLEMAQAEITRLEKLIPAAQKEGINVDAAKAALGNAKKVFKNGSTLVARDMANTAYLNLMGSLSPYAWLEGETTVGQNFDEIAAGTRASLGRYLLLNAEADAPMSPYSATYSLTVPKEGDYTIWIAGYVPGVNASPISYSINGLPWVDIAELKPEGPSYGPGFNWSKLGTVNLKAGQHTFSIKVTGRRKSDNKYVMALDAILFTIDPFIPQGIKKPEYGKQ